MRTRPGERKVMVRHDAEIEITVDSPIFGHYTQTTEAIYLDAALTVESIKHGMVSGYHDGRNVPKVSYRLVNPERDTIPPGTDCPCPHTELHV